MTPETSTEMRTLDWLPQPVLVVDDRGVLFVNLAATQLLGADASSLRSRPVTDYLPLALMGAGGGPSPAQAEHSILHADGTERRVEIAVTSWPPDSRGDRRLLVLHDITAHRGRADLLLRGRDRLRELGARRERVGRQHRWRLARQVHDTVQQSLAAMLFELDALSACGDCTSDPARTALERIRRLATDSLRNTGEMIDELQPLIVEELSLEESLGSVCRQFAGRVQVACRMGTILDAQAFDDAPLEWRILAHECLKDALAEVRHYAGLTSVRVDLAASPDDRLLMRLTADTSPSAQPLLERATQEIWSLGERLRAAGGRLDLSVDEAGRPAVQLTMPPILGASASTDGEEQMLPEHSYETLLRFFYQVPVGLLMLAPDGTILMLNPAAARMLVPLAQGGDMSNLFALLRRGRGVRLDASAVGRLEIGASTTPVSIDLPSTPAGHPGPLDFTLKRLSDGGFAAALAHGVRNLPGTGAGCG